MTFTAFPPGRVGGCATQGVNLRGQQRGAVHVVCAYGKRGDVLLIADDVSKTHDGERMLFQNLSFTIRCGQPCGMRRMHTDHAWHAWSLQRWQLAWHVVACMPCLQLPKCMAYVPCIPFVSL